jgi:energy-coupling factor transporter ATP-binding protein EcfA2
MVGMTEVSNLMNFCSELLSRQEIEDISAIKHSDVRGTFKSAQQGLLPRNELLKVWPGSGEGATADDHVKILIAPWTLRNSKSKVNFAIIWIQAKLYPSGKLEHDGAVLPFIPPSFLSSSEIDGLSVIDEARLTQAFETIEIGVSFEWKHLIAAVEDILSDLIGHSLDRWLPEGFEKGDAAYKAAEAGSFHASIRHIIGKAGANSNQLITKIASRKNTPSKAQTSSAVELLGLMPQRQNLNKEQINAVNSTLRLTEGEYLAVHGPPGTGKTSFLSAIVASYFVKAALKGRPAIIGVTSYNKQAVQNAMLSLSSHDDGIRWLPELGGFATLIFGQGDDKVAPGLENTAFDAQCKRVFDRDFIEGLELRWRNNFERQMGHESSDLERDVQLLQSKLRRFIENKDKIEHHRKVVEAFNTEAAVQELQNISREIAVHTERGRLFEDDKSEIRGNLENLQSHLHRIGRLVQDHHSQSFAAMLFKKITRRSRREFSEVRAELIREGIHQAANVKSGSVRTLLDEVTFQISLEFGELKSTLNDSIYPGTDELRSLRDCKRMIEERVRRFENSAEFLRGVGISDETRKERAKLEEFIRKRLVCGAFALAVKIMEGLFLVRAKQNHIPLVSEDVTKAQLVERSTVEALSYVFPVHVGNLHSFARFFGRPGGRKDASPAYDIFDLLIMDEAGQTSAFFGIPLLCLAKTAVFVGDVKQIPPIDTGTALTVTSMSRKHLQPRFEDELKASNLLRPSTSILEWSSSSSAYTDGASEQYPGIWLREHFRCEDAIISYSNDLVYRGILIPKKRDKGKGMLPPLAYAHVRGHTVRPNGTSPQNEVEADTIISWIKQNEAELVRHYKRPIEQIVGVITPYKQQSELLNQKFQSNFSEEFRVGTVHVFQGAEMPVILYSAVKTYWEEIGKFDQNPRILNVAVSRAQDTFVFVGDFRIFDKVGDKSSLGLLRSHIVRSSAEPLFGFTPIINKKGAIRLRGSKEHDKCLLSLLEGAKGRVTISCLKCELRKENRNRLQEVLNAVHVACSRGVKVKLMIGVTAWNKVRDLEAIQHALQDIKHENLAVFTSNRWHSKTVLIDEETILEGSFNWLASWEGDLGFEDRSMIISGKEAYEQVRAAWRDMDDLTLHCVPLVLEGRVDF